MGDGLFNRKRQQPAEAERSDSPPAPLQYVESLDDEQRHDYLRQPEHASERERYFDVHPHKRLDYFRREPEDLRKYLQQRVKRDEHFKQWTKDARYDLSDTALDPIVLGLMWVPPEKDEKGNVKKPGRVGEPFIVSRDLMKEGHIHVRGRTRSGKSALAITPLVQQLIRPYQVRYRTEEGKKLTKTMKDPIFIIDLGGDLALFNYAQKLAHDEGRTFRFLSLEDEDAWHYFDPFQAAGYEKTRIVQIAVLLQKAFSLDHGLAYAASYFTSRNLQALLDVVHKLYQQQTAASVTLDEVADYLEEANVKDAEEIRMIFRFLTEYRQLKPFDIYDEPNPQREDVINLERALENEEVVYFFLPTLSESITARQIAGLALYTLIDAAQKRVRKPENQGGVPLPHAWVFVDEFQQLAGSSFADVLAQASKFGLSLIMANQTTTQLEVRDINLADVVRDNTYCKVYFTITGEQDIKALKSFSKEYRGLLAGTAQTQFEYLGRETQQEYLTTVLHTDEILDASNTNQHCFMLLDDGTGHREPVRLWMDYAMTYDEFRHHKTTPPPLFDGERRAPVVPDKAEPLWKIARKKMDAPPWQPSLTALLQTKRQEESF